MNKENANSIDIPEDDIYNIDSEILKLLLKDRTTGRNILWGTNDYAQEVFPHSEFEEILIQDITGGGMFATAIQPRAAKSKEVQDRRIRNKAEVFTPSWICNKQNNLVDNAWFGTDFVFNEETEKTWVATTTPIVFPTATGKTWQDYIDDVRLEITCGEAPYLASRYGTVSGYMIELSQRIGLLDRKLRVVSENSQTEKEWLKWATKSFQNTYGYDWQGDNILLARENLLFTFIDYYKAKFNKEPAIDILKKIANILSWNIWQMDGLKFVVPGSCKNVENYHLNLIEAERENCECPGCTKNDPYAHRGIYCIIKDWKTNQTVEFVSLLKKN